MCQWVSVVITLFVFLSLNNISIHSKESKGELPCCSHQSLLHFPSCPSPEIPLLAAPTCLREQEACPLCVCAQHISGLSSQKASRHGVPWDYTNTQVQGVGIARLSSVTVQLASTASMCLPKCVPNQADIRWFQTLEFRQGLRASMSMAWCSVDMKQGRNLAWVHCSSIYPWCA